MAIKTINTHNGFNYVCTIITVCTILTTYWLFVNNLKVFKDYVGTKWSFEVSAVSFQKRLMLADWFIEWRINFCVGLWLPGPLWAAYWARRGSGCWCTVPCEGPPGCAQPVYTAAAASLGAGSISSSRERSLSTSFPDTWQREHKTVISPGLNQFLTRSKTRIN